MTYADDFNLRNKDVVKIGDIANAVDGLLATAYNVQVAAKSTTSTSAVQIASLSQAVTVADGESVVLLFSGTFSHSTANGRTSFGLYRDSSQVAPGVLLDAVDNNGTSGVASPICLQYIETPSAGAYTYSVYWLVDTGTAYLSYGTLSILKVQTS